MDVLTQLRPMLEPDKLRAQGSVCLSPLCLAASCHPPLSRALCPDALLSTCAAQYLVQSHADLDCEQLLSRQTAGRLAGGRFCIALHCIALLCCAVLCCAVLCCAVLCCAVLCCAALCCAVLCCAVLCCAVPCCLLAPNALMTCGCGCGCGCGFGCFAPCSADCFQVKEVVDPLAWILHNSIDPESVAGSECPASSSSSNARVLTVALGTRA
jgi:hypothetical protein